MKHGSLFSGIDGFSMAADWIGWETLFTCEINEFCNIILDYYHKNETRYRDIRAVDFSVWKGIIDVLSGGFPCQPYSQSGKRIGKKDDRHLWPEMLRAIREISPRWVVGENVRGIISWNGGMVFDEVQSDLEAIGYEVLPLLLPAAGVKAPHERYRIFFVAHSNSNDSGRCGYGETGCSQRKMQGEQEKRERIRCELERIGGERTTPNTGRLRGDKIFQDIQPQQSKRERTNGNGFKWNAPNPNCSLLQNGNEGRKGGWKNQTLLESLDCSGSWEKFPTQSPVCTGNDGFPAELLRRRIRDDSMGILSEKEIDKIISKAASFVGKEAIKAGGNAVVPQLVLQIYKAIQNYENIYNRL